MLKNLGVIPVMVTLIVNLINMDAFSIIGSILTYQTIEKIKNYHREVSVGPEPQQ